MNFHDETGEGVALFNLKAGEHHYSRVDSLHLTICLLNSCDYFVKKKQNQSDLIFNVFLAASENTHLSETNSSGTTLY